jgi:hypothetical protein
MPRKLVALGAVLIAALATAKVAAPSHLHDANCGRVHDRHLDDPAANPDRATLAGRDGKAIALVLLVAIDFTAWIELRPFCSLPRTRVLPTLDRVGTRDGSAADACCLIRRATFEP